jgi:hypothetical protein
MNATTNPSVPDREAARRLFESVQAFGPTVTVLKPSLDRIDAGVSSERRWSKINLFLTVATLGVQVAILSMVLPTPRPQEQPTKLADLHEAAVPHKAPEVATKADAPTSTCKPSKASPPDEKVPDHPHDKPAIPAKPDQLNPSPQGPNKGAATAPPVYKPSGTWSNPNQTAKPSPFIATKQSAPGPYQPNTGPAGFSPSYQSYGSQTCTPAHLTYALPPCQPPGCYVIVPVWSNCGPAYILVNP